MIRIQQSLPPLLLLYFTIPIFPQNAYISGGLTARYGNGNLLNIEIGDKEKESYVYREYNLDVSAGYRNFSLWSNFEFSFPPQIGPYFSGLRKLRLTWEMDRLLVSVGNLYGLIGRGLGFNLWESQEIDWDSSLQGIWIKAKIGEQTWLDFVSGKEKGGRHLPQGPGVNPRRRDFSDDADASVISIMKSYPNGGPTIGAYFVEVDAKNPWFDKIQNYLTKEYEVVDSVTVQTISHVPGFFLEYVKGKYDFYIEAMFRKHEIKDADSLFSTTLQKWFYYKENTPGWGGYMSFSFYPNKFGLTVELKNYLLSISNPEKREKYLYQLERRSPVQSPPTVFKIHTSALLSRTPHIMDFMDEIGVQIEMNYEATTNLFLLFNYTQSNRHGSFRKIVHPDFSTGWEKKMLPTEFTIQNKERFFPFREIYGEMNYYYHPFNLDFQGGVSISEEILSYNESVVEKAGYSGWLASHSKESLNWEKRNLITVPTQLTFNLPSGIGIILYWEHQWEDLEFRNRIRFKNISTSDIDSITTDTTTSEPYYYRYVSLSIGKPSKYSFGIIYDYTSRIKTGHPQNVHSFNDNWLEMVIRLLTGDITNKWFGLQFSAYFTPSTLLSLFYGSLQGGLKCDSGVCVYIPGIEDALTVTLTTNF